MSRSGIQTMLRHAHVEDLQLTEQAPAHLMTLLERRAEDVLACLNAARRQAEASQANSSQLEQQNRALSDDLAVLNASGSEFEARLMQLEQQVVALEAVRLELAEENRELDEQNRELESHNRHLQERLADVDTAEAQPRRARQSKGLLALMGHQRSVSPAVPEEAGLESADKSMVQESPVQESPVQETPPSIPAATQSKPATEQAPSPQALLTQWYSRYDSAFFKGHTRPLKIGIHEDLAEHEPWPEKLVRRALACYVNLPRYLKAVRDGAERIDLDGQPAGRVDESAETHACRKLARLQAERANNKGSKRASGGKRAKGNVHNGSDERTPAGRSSKRKAGAVHKRHGDRVKPAEDVDHSAHSGQGVVSECGGAEVDSDNPAERIQRKLDALMARHSEQ